MKLSSKQFKYFFEVSSPILNHPEYLKLRQYNHHFDTNRYQHCYDVALLSYIHALKYHKNVNVEAVIRGALLHDFYLFDTQNKGTRPVNHRKTHPKKALDNALKYFELNDIEKDIILKHMFPLTNKLPKYPESLIVLNCDNICSIYEAGRFSKRNVRVVNN